MSWNQARRRRLAAAVEAAGRGQSPWAASQPPNFEDSCAGAGTLSRRSCPGGWGRDRGFILVARRAVVLFWLASGFYRVEPDEEGIVLRFGAFDADHIRASIITCRGRSKKRSRPR